MREETDDDRIEEGFAAMTDPQGRKQK